MYRGLKKVYLKNDNLECIPSLQRHDDIIYVLPNNDMYTWNGTCRKWQLVSGEIGDDFANYYNKQEIDEKENNIYEEINNNKNECNEKYESLNNKLENNYYTKNEIDVKHDIINDELNSINNKFNNYYTQSEINTLLDEIGCKCDLSQFYTREEIDTKINTINNKFEPLLYDTGCIPLSPNIDNLYFEPIGCYYRKKGNVVELNINAIINYTIYEGVDVITIIPEEISPTIPLTENINIIITEPILEKQIFQGSIIVETDGRIILNSVDVLPSHTVLNLHLTYII